MEKDKIIYIMNCDSPALSCARVLDDIDGGNAGALILTRSRQQADYYKAEAAKKNGGRVPPGLNSFSFNSFVETCPYADLSGAAAGYADYEAKSLLLLKAAAGDPGLADFKIDLRFMNYLSEAVSELKSNNININFLKKSGAFKNLSFKCSKLLEIYGRYQKLLSDKGLRDYHDRVISLSCDGGFYDYIKNSYDLIVFDRPEMLSPIETDLSALIVAAGRRVVIITDKTACEINPQQIAVNRIIKRAGEIGCSVSFESLDAAAALARPERLRCEKALNSLGTTSLESGFIREIPCGGLAEEAALIARAISATALRENIALSRFAVFMPGFSRSRKYIGTAFSAYGISFKANEGRGASEFPSVDKLLRVIDFLESGDADSFVPLVSLSAFKRFEPFKNVRNLAGVLKKLLAATKLFSRGEAHDERSAAASIDAENDFGGGDAAVMARLYEQIGGFMKNAAGIVNVEYYTLPECFNVLTGLLEREGFCAGENESGRGPLSLAISAMHSFASNAVRLGADEKFKFSTALGIFRGLVSSTFVPDSFDPLKTTAASEEAVIIHTKPNINLFEYDYLFIAGAVEGVLPSFGSGSASFFFDSPDRALLSLCEQPPQIYSERALFHRLLASPARGTFLSAPSSHLNRRFIRSRFFGEVENVSVYDGGGEILCGGDLLECCLRLEPGSGEIEKISGFYGVPRAELDASLREIALSTETLCDRDSKLKSRFMFDCSAIREDHLLAHLYKRPGVLRASPTLIEKFYFCPGRYFFEKELCLKAESKYSGELDPMDEGVIIHETLERFFSDVTAKEALRDYYFNETGRGAMKQAIEKLLFSAGYAAVKKGGLERRFGAAYQNIKMLQYFNALNGYERSESESDAVSGISGYFKNFIDDYLESLTVQNFYLEPAAVEFELTEGLSCRGREVEFAAKCDRIDACLTEENGQLYFFVTDYKTGITPQASEIKTLRKLQAPFYLYFLEKKLNAELASRGTALGRKASSAAGAGFVYTSISKLDKDLRPEKRFFISARFAAPKSSKKGEAKEGARDGEFKITVSQRARKDYDDIMEQVPGVIETFIEKTARGDFHASVLEGHDCGFCGFNGICHRNRKAGVSAARALARTGEVDNGRRI
ncbi:MAG: hypothetical protein A2008_06355 [Candidatus Wallbacteria bacterium GWC2_49_35]|uniref:PD-(D/E)XK endonuclease-like domain-containing protein n=1 Tax=Candidatus Wallbacteria bacterium GWC2_49_35 TaxID=1817813 RepID=A0A1F7WQV1_9BACT|nr:MAG: hypothetical protein A2008_06355 [Candidatus Wallbacteria bacterium GWC2_49_35]